MVNFCFVHESVIVHLLLCNSISCLLGLLFLFGSKMRDCSLVLWVRFIILQCILLSCVYDVGGEDYRENSPDSSQSSTGKGQEAAVTSFQSHVGNYSCI